MKKKVALSLLITACINSFYLFSGVWQRFIDIITLLDDGSFWGGVLSISAFLITASTTVLAGVFITKIFRNSAVLGRRKWLLFSITLLFLAPIVYYDFGPGQRTCSHDTECAEAFYDCCPSCKAPKEAVNRSYRSFRKNMNLCFLSYGCPLVDCKTLPSSKAVCKQGVCQLGDSAPLIPEQQPPAGIIRTCEYTMGEENCGKCYCLEIPEKGCEIIDTSDIGGLAYAVDKTVEYEGTRNVMCTRMCPCYIKLFSIKIVPSSPTPELGEVTLSTDKTEYEWGGVVTAIIVNETEKSIFYSSYFPFELYKYGDEKWEIFVYRPILMGEPPYPLVEVKAGTGTKIADLINTERTAPGRYKLGFKYTLKDKEETVYSNEFTIKIDSRCRLEPLGGPCKAYIARYYFDQAEGVCKEFIWGGCEGVVPFNALGECQGVCEK